MFFLVELPEPLKFLKVRYLQWANTATFSVVNGVLLQPLPYPHASRLVNIFETTSEFSRSSVAYPNYLDWRRASRSLIWAFIAALISISSAMASRRRFPAYTFQQVSFGYLR